jgi:hypothetical protein
MTSIDSDPLSFRSDNDVRLDKDWRSQTDVSSIRDRDRSPGWVPVTSSPVSLYGPDCDHDPFEVRMPAVQERGQHHLFGADAVGNSLQDCKGQQRHNSDPSSYSPELPMAVPERSLPRRWFSREKHQPAKKGLNPGAKTFSIRRPQSPPHSLGAGNVFDALNPNGIGSGMSVPAANSSSLLRAFAPSPEEREALKRALGSSTNTSLELLPSLSEVGSIPPSPNHVHTQIHQDISFNGPTHQVLPGRAIPSWLQGFPRIRKSNFSPWEDEEPTMAAPVGMAFTDDNTGRQA